MEGFRISMSGAKHCCATVVGIEAAEEEVAEDEEALEGSNIMCCFSYSRLKRLTTCAKKRERAKLVLICTCRAHRKTYPLFVHV